MNGGDNLDKKILIVSSWAPPMVGGPQHLYNIFSQFPKNSYSIITSAKNMQKAVQTNVKGSMLPCQYYYFDEPALDRKDAAISDAPKKTNPQSSRLRSNFVIFGKIIIHYLSEIYFIWLYVIETVKILKKSQINLLIGVSDT